jgi:hypothetical protein
MAVNPARTHKLFAKAPPRCALDDVIQPHLLVTGTGRTDGIGRMASDRRWLIRFVQEIPLKFNFQSTGKSYNQA